MAISVVLRGQYSSMMQFMFTHISAVFAGFAARCEEADRGRRGNQGAEHCAGDESSPADTGFDTSLC